MPFASSASTVASPLSGPQRRVEREQADVHRLAGLVDRLVGFEEENRVVFDRDRAGVAETLAADRRLVVARRQFRHGQRHAAAPWHPIGRLGHRFAVLQQRDRDRAVGRLIALEERQRDRLRLARAEGARRDGQVAVGRLVYARHWRRRGASLPIHRHCRLRCPRPHRRAITRGELTRQRQPAARRQNQGRARAGEKGAPGHAWTIRCILRASHDRPPCNVCCDVCRRSFRTTPARLSCIWGEQCARVGKSSSAVRKFGRASCLERQAISGPRAVERRLAILPCWCRTAITGF